MADTAVLTSTPTPAKRGPGRPKKTVVVVAPEAQEPVESVPIPIEKAEMPPKRRLGRPKKDASESKKSVADPNVAEITETLSTLTVNPEPKPRQLIFEVELTLNTFVAAVKLVKGKQQTTFEIPLSNSSIKEILFRYAELIGKTPGTDHEDPFMNLVVLLENKPCKFTVHAEVLTDETVLSLDLSKDRTISKVKTTLHANVKILLSNLLAVTILNAYETDLKSVRTKKPPLNPLEHVSTEVVE